MHGVWKRESGSNSDNIQELGGYLTDTLGALNIDTYLNDEGTRDRVDRYVARVVLLLRAPDTEFEKAESIPVEVAPLEPSQPPAVTTREKDPPAIKIALKQVAAGEIWNGLALVRRDLEGQLRERSASVAAGTAPRNLSAFRALSERGKDAFRQFWRVASQAIHGSEVTYEDALNAILSARFVYDEIDGIVYVPSSKSQSSLSVGDRIFHQKFGYGRIRAVEGNKLTVDFDKAGEKRVIDSFVIPASAA